MKKVAALTSKIYKAVGVLEAKVEQAKALEDAEKLAFFYHDEVLVAMDELRSYADELETITPKDLWPFPSYGDILFSVK